MFRLKHLFYFLFIIATAAQIALAMYAIGLYKNYKPSTIDLGKVTYLNHTIIKTTNNTTFARCRGFFDFDCIDIESMDIEIGCQLYEHKTFTHSLYSCD